MLRDGSSLRRQWILLKSLHSRHYGLTVREMAKETGVADKTIRRDLEAFRGAGFQLEEAVGEFGRKTWRLAGPANPLPLSFNFEEAVALYLGRRLLEPLAGTLFWQAAQQAFGKIRAAIDSKHLDYLERFAGFFHPTLIGAGDYSAKAELIDTLMVAVEDGKATHIFYRSERATEPASRPVYPYGLILHKARLYLIAFDPEADKIKHYKIDRIDEVEISPFPFSRPEGFSLGAHLATTFGIYQGDGEPTTVRVRFTPAAARYILESKWQGCRKLDKQRDGSVLAEFRVSITPEFRSWLLGFGAKAHVLEPEQLRREIVEDLKSSLSSYNSDVESVGPRTTSSKGSTHRNRRT
jgi:predicted DNA-binding transcriptional regulator YafY